MGEAEHQVESQIDRIELDMGDGVQKRNPPCRRAQPSTRYLARRHEFRGVRAGWSIRRGGNCGGRQLGFSLAIPPCPRGFVRRGDLVGGSGALQNA